MNLFALMEWYLSILESLSVVIVILKEWSFSSHVSLKSIQLQTVKSVGDMHIGEPKNACESEGSEPFIKEAISETMEISKFKSDTDLRDSSQTVEFFMSSHIHFGWR